MSKTTISVIKADVGSFPGHSRTHPRVLEKAAKILKAEEGNLLTDSFVTHCGDDLELILTHTHGVDNEKIHKLVWDVFRECTKIANEMKLHGAGQDILSSTFSGNLRGLGPGVAEMEFEERESDPVLIFMADKTGSGAWNFFLSKIFADPFNTVGLVTDPAMHRGFVFEVRDLVEKRMISLSCPEETYTLLGFIRDSSRYVITRVFNHDGVIVASSSSQSLDLADKKFVGNRDPVMIVRCQNGFPAVGEALEPFCTPALVAGWIRGSHQGPLMPVAVCDANCTRSDGPPRVICLGFQVANGELIGPADMFDDPGFERVRSRCNELADVIRAQGPFESHHHTPNEKESSSNPTVEKDLKTRWKPIPE